jgi:hypothetical protein
MTPASGKLAMLEARHAALHQPRLAAAPFVLRVTAWKEVVGPVLVIKERRSRDESVEGGPRTLAERGCMHGDPLRRVLPVLRQIVEKVVDEGGRPLEVERFLTADGMRLLWTLVLDEEAGAKLGILFKVQERAGDLDRIELMARRIASFSREEAGYWFSRMSHWGPDANRWAVSGMRTMLGGFPRDPGVGRMLERARTKL